MISLIVVTGTWVEVGEKKMKNIKYDANRGSPASHSRNHQPLFESSSTIDLAAKLEDSGSLNSQGITCLILCLSVLGKIRTSAPTETIVVRPLIHGV